MSTSEYHTERDFEFVNTISGSMNGTELSDSQPSKSARREVNSSRPGHKKSRTGCSTCKTRRVKCDETKPTCSACTRLRRTCEYLVPSREGSRSPVSIRSASSRPTTRDGDHIVSDFAALQPTWTSSLDTSKLAEFPLVPTNALATNNTHSNLTRPLPSMSYGDPLPEVTLKQVHRVQVSVSKEMFQSTVPTSLTPSVGVTNDQNNLAEVLPSMDDPPFESRTRHWDPYLYPSPHGPSALVSQYMPKNYTHQQEGYNQQGGNSFTGLQDPDQWPKTE